MPDSVWGLLSYSDGQDALHLKILDRYLRKQNIAMEGRVEVWSIESIKRGVMSNLGAVCLPRFTVEEECRGGSLVELPTQIVGGEMKAVCAYDRGKWGSPAMELFLQTLKAYVPYAKEDDRDDAT